MLKAIALIALSLSLEGAFILHTVVAAPAPRTSVQAPPAASAAVADVSPGAIAAAR